MAEKIRPCFGGVIRHSWQFLRNVEQVTKIVRATSTEVHVKVKGRYRCRQCGTIKLGQSQFVASTPEEQQS